MQIVIEMSEEDYINIKVGAWEKVDAIKLYKIIEDGKVISRDKHIVMPNEEEYIPFSGKSYAC